ncbi:Serine/threonine-protein kinase PknA [Rubripirellula tenax]|uniref:non-specific serine/threonine protein kinase n=1 Tax=Rubripirellula tenax TaxID=2528015 RepID=A0A5C6F4V4_9BACT|nr:serine/threonine-protein kinase [Rubripirellula tenax]TWU54859.1 Serine/threonine-protein kinase PknA [Rubripirellula tenax]
MPPDEYLGPYKLGELIGRGGMGVVYAGQHIKSGERVAVKLIAAHVSDDQRFRRRFAAEIRALKMLRHKGIVRIIGEGEDNQGRLFYSMELISGETLQALIRRLKKLPVPMVLDLSVQIASALKHAHDIGVTHRDLKPANLILTDDGTIKLVDFGIPKVFGDSSEQTQSGSVLGTPDYMAPEQAVGGPITPRTDLYSLGSVMYAMLLGRAPFKGRSSTEVIDALMRDRPIPLDLVNSALPEELTAIVHQMLEKKPEDRPPTALSVMKRLKLIQSTFARDATLSSDSALTDAGKKSATSDTNIVDPVTHGSGDVAKAAAKRDSVSTAPQDPRSDSGRSDPTSSDVAADQSTRMAGETNHDRSSPVARTVVSRGGNTVRAEASDSSDTSATAPGGSESETRARFTTVGNLGTEHTTATDAKSSSQSLLHGSLLVVMVVVLLAIGYTFYRSIQPPTPEKLYASILSSGDLAKMNAFIRQYPNDGRIEEVRDLANEATLSATLNRLRVQAKIGLVEMGPAEEGFMVAMKNRKTEPIETAERIEHWINAFENSIADDSESLGELLQLARHEQRVLRRRSPMIVMDPRTSKLIEDIRAAAEFLDADEAKKKLNGIVETFANEQWAKPAVDEARRRLELLK